jgi:hypothetical protein
MSHTRNWQCEAHAAGSWHLEFRRFFTLAQMQTAAMASGQKLVAVDMDADYELMKGRQREAVDITAVAGKCGFAGESTQTRGLFECLQGRCQA